MNDERKKLLALFRLVVEFTAYSDNVKEIPCIYHLDSLKGTRALFLTISSAVLIDDCKQRGFYRRLATPQTKYIKHQKLV